MGELTNQEKYDQLISEVNWENWTDENGDFMDISGVLYSKLEGVKEQLVDNDEREESMDTIDMVQLLLELLDEEKIRSIL